MMALRLSLSRHLCPTFRLILHQSLVLLLVALCFLLSSSSTPPASAAPTKKSVARQAGQRPNQQAVQQVIQSAYNDEDTATMDHDLDGVLLPYAEDTLFISDVQGTEGTGLAFARQGWVALYKLPQKLTAAVHQIKKITVSKTNTGATILVMQQFTLSGTTKSGIPYEMKNDEMIRHYWGKTEDGWRIKQERILSSDSFLNGRLFRHNHKPVAP